MKFYKRKVWGENRFDGDGENVENLQYLHQAITISRNNYFFCSIVKVEAARCPSHALPALP